MGKLKFSSYTKIWFDNPRAGSFRVKEEKGRESHRGVERVRWVILGEKFWQILLHNWK
jgi:hypothetical protein